MTVRTKSLAALWRLSLNRFHKSRPRLGYRISACHCNLMEGTFRHEGHCAVLKNNGINLIVGQVLPSSGSVELLADFRDDHKHLGESVKFLRHLIYSFARKQTSPEHFTL